MTMIYRVDKFEVPEDARAEFWANVRRTHAVLRAQPGFVDDALLEKYSGVGTFNAVTIVRWSSAGDLPGARAAVERAHREAQFDPAAFFAERHILADVANYVEVDG